MGRGISINGHRLMKMPQSFGIERYVYRAFFTGSNRCLRPLCGGTSTIRFHIRQHQRFCARIGNDVLYGQRMFPFDLPCTMQLGVRCETSLSLSACYQSSTQTKHEQRPLHKYVKFFSFHSFFCYLLKQTKVVICSVQCEKLGDKYYESLGIPPILSIFVRLCAKKFL